MAFYENRCLRCRHEFESQQSIKDETRPRCPKCGGRSERLISRTVFQLKGYSAANGYSDPPPKKGKGK